MSSSAQILPLFLKLTGAQGGGGRRGRSPSPSWMRSRARPPGSPWWPRRFAPRDRQAAYAVVQRNAMKVFDQGRRLPAAGGRDLLLSVPEQWVT
jgi:hypothetical protein